MFSEIEACLTLIQSIYDLYNTIKSNKEAIVPLSKRVLILKNFLKDLKIKLKIDSNTATIDESLKLSLKSSELILSDVNKYIKKLKGGTGFYESAKKAFRTICLSKTTQKELEDLNVRLYSQMSILMPSLAINFEEERRKDHEAFSRQIDGSTEEILSNLKNLGGNSSDILDYLNEIRAQTDASNAEVISKIEELETKINSRNPLKPIDLTALGVKLDEANGKFKSYLDQKFEDV